MKKTILRGILAAGILLTGLSASGISAEATSKTEEVTVKIGLSPVPHEEIAKEAKEELKKEGINLEIIVFDDYMQPNLALKDKDLDANFFQHLPYLDKFNKENNTKIVSLGGIHLEPISFYSAKVKKIEELKEGAEIIIPNDATNGSRSLFLLEKNGLLKLKEGVKLPTVADITENPKRLKFTEVEAALIPGAYKDADGAIINSNYALGAGLNPLTDGIITEDKESPYANVIAVNEERKDDPILKKVYAAFTSERVKKFIDEKYKGAIVPAF